MKILINLTNHLDIPKCWVTLILKKVWVNFIFFRVLMNDDKLLVKKAMVCRCVFKLLLFLQAWQFWVSENALYLRIRKPESETYLEAA